MSDVIVVGTLTPKPGQEAALEEALVALAAPTHDEQGCVVYAVHRENGDGSRMAMVERWASQADLDAHMGSAHIAGLIGRMDELLAAPPDIVLYTPVPAGRPERGAIGAAAA